jgi:Flp pilus assembly protein TadG
MSDIVRQAIRLWRDRRGIAAMEAVLVLPILIALLLPITDLGLAALQYMSAYQALRDVGAYAQYHIPSDLIAQWTSPDTSVTATIMCTSSLGQPQVCSSPFGNPKWFVFTNHITLKPMFPALSAVCPSGQTTCTYPITFTQRFQ